MHYLPHPFNKIIQPSYLRFLTVLSSFFSPAAETGAASVFVLSSGVTASVFLVDYIDVTMSSKTNKKIKNPTLVTTGFCAPAIIFTRALNIPTRVNKAKTRTAPVSG